MFNARFYSEVLPELVGSQCNRQPDKTPVVEFKLGDGTVLDVCHVARLSEDWFSVTYFRDAQSCDEMDVCLLPYELVVRVNIALHHQQSRRLGFSVRDTVRGGAESDVGEEAANVGRS
jgi:hypothetical protein